MPEDQESAAQPSATNVPPAGEEKKDKRGLARKIVDHVQPRVKLFHTPDGEAYVRFRKGGHEENHRVQSKDFRMWLTHGARGKFDSPPSKSVVDTVITALEAVAITSGAENRVHYRYARIGEAIYIDLGS